MSQTFVAIFGLVIYLEQGDIISEEILLNLIKEPESYTEHKFYTSILILDHPQQNEFQSTILKVVKTVSTKINQEIDIYYLSSFELPDIKVFSDQFLSKMAKLFTDC